MYSFLVSYTYSVKTGLDQVMEVSKPESQIILFRTNQIGEPEVSALEELIAELTGYVAVELLSFSLLEG